jgi:hypothetical protein
VLEVYHAVYQRLIAMQSGDDLERVLTLPAILEVRDWVAECLASSSPPTDAELRAHLAGPLLRQLKIDSGVTVHRLAEERLGLDAAPVSVRAQAKALGVTRARIYQLLDDCGRVMGVRWPDGQARMGDLAARLTPYQHDQPQLRLFFACRELFFPEKAKDGLPSLSVLATGPEPVIAHVGHSL